MHMFLYVTIKSKECVYVFIGTGLHVGIFGDSLRYSLRPTKDTKSTHS